MKSQVLVQMNSTSVWKSVKSAVLNSAVMSSIATLCSNILEEPVSALLALHLLNAQLSFAFLVLFGGIFPVVAVLLLVWFSVAVWQCVQVYKREKELSENA